MENILETIDFWTPILGWLNVLFIGILVLLVMLFVKSVREHRKVLKRVTLGVGIPLFLATIFLSLTTLYPGALSLEKMLHPQQQVYVESVWIFTRLKTNQEDIVGQRVKTLDEAASKSWNVDRTLYDACIVDQWRPASVPADVPPSHVLQGCGW